MTISTDPIAELEQRITALETTADAHQETLAHIVETLKAMHETQAKLMDLLENL